MHRQNSAHLCRVCAFDIIGQMMMMMMVVVVVDDGDGTWPFYGGGSVLCEYV